MSTLQAQVLKHASSAASNIALDSTGKSTFGGLIDTGSVGQIKFPATQNSSSDANTLDDYEEGTFLPTVFGASTAGTCTYTVQQGRYTKVGKIVTFMVRVGWNSHTGTGSLTIGNLPFFVDSVYYAGSVAFRDGIAMPAGGQMLIQINGNATSVTPLSVQSGSAYAAGFAIPATGGDLCFSGSYLTTT